MLRSGRPLYFDGDHVSPYRQQDLVAGIRIGFEPIGRRCDWQVRAMSASNPLPDKKRTAARVRYRGSAS